MLLGILCGGNGVCVFPLRPPACPSCKRLCSWRWQAGGPPSLRRPPALTLFGKLLYPIFLSTITFPPPLIPSRNVLGLSCLAGNLWLCHLSLYFSFILHLFFSLLLSIFTYSYPPLPLSSPLSFLVPSPFPLHDTPLRRSLRAPPSFRVVGPSSSGCCFVPLVLSLFI